MNILVVSRFGSKLFGVLRQGETHTITHCADGAKAVAELRNSSTKYDWIVVQGDAIALRNMEVAGVIRAMGLSVTLAHTLVSPQHESWTCLLPPRTREGISILPPSYAFEPFQRHQLAVAERWNEHDVVLVEYHAPVKKRFNA